MNNFNLILNLNANCASEDAWIAACHLMYTKKNYKLGASISRTGLNIFYYSEQLNWFKEYFEFFSKSIISLNSNSEIKSSLCNKQIKEIYFNINNSIYISDKTRWKNILNEYTIIISTIINKDLLQEILIDKQRLILVKPIEFYNKIKSDKINFITDYHVN